MGLRKTRDQAPRLVFAGIVAAFLVGASYRWFNRGSSSLTQDGNSGKNQSICLILSEGLWSKGVDWNRLSERDAVVILTPDFKEAPAQDLFPKHRVIRCSTHEGVWYVVRHLRKDVVIVEKQQIEQIPSDIYKFSRPIENLPWDQSASS
ncbi:LADA_0A08768g1_1 [Lachancea dasiensis]|uniref:Peroxisome assembly protein 22 n=1 Tax=Lachancea dasiensis TaxID=1072105 RepID=A0A1G4IQA8_9SACH|nr:LADA_0A08768g1_1 [Lachancea dasiensis]